MNSVNDSAIKHLKGFFFQFCIPAAQVSIRSFSDFHFCNNSPVQNPFPICAFADWRPIEVTGFIRCTAHSMVDEPNSVFFRLRGTSPQSFEVWGNFGTHGPNRHLHGFSPVSRVTSVARDRVEHQQQTDKLNSEHKPHPVSTLMLSLRNQTPVKPEIKKSLKFTTQNGHSDYTHTRHSM